MSWQGPPGPGRKPEPQPIPPAACWTLQDPGLARPETALPGFSQAQQCTERVGIDWGSPACMEAPQGAHSRGLTPIVLEGIQRPESILNLAQVLAGVRMGVALPPSSPPFPGPQFA